MRAGTEAIRLRGAAICIVCAGLLALGCGVSPALAAAAPAPAASAAAPAPAASAAAAAPVPPGTLTDHEFTVLSAAELGLQSALSAGAPDWHAARSACDSVGFGASTPFLAVQRADCFRALALVDALTSFPDTREKCARRGDTGEIRCLGPVYESLARKAADGYRIDLKTRQVTVGRGFTGACLKALASTPRALGEERRLAAAAKQLSADTSLEINVSEGRTSPSRLRPRAIGADDKKFRRDANSLLNDDSSPKLTVCPHQD